MSLTVILIIVIVLASMYAWKNQQVMARWMMNPYVIHSRKQYDRLLTSGFIHADQGHLFFNMFALFFFGRNVEFIFQYMFGAEIGAALFIGLFLLGVVVANLPSLKKYKDYPGYNGLGASGGVSAIVFSSILINPVEKICLYFFICLPGFIMGALYLIYSYYQGKRGDTRVGHDAHFTGAVFGLVFTIILKPSFLSSFIQQVLHFRIEDIF